MFNRFALKTLIASSVAAAAVVAVAPAAAAIDAPRSMTVRYSDLDLTSSAGRARLNKRVAFAAEIVCGPADTLSYHSTKAVAGCRDRAIADAQAVMVQVFAGARAPLRVAAD